MADNPVLTFEVYRGEEFLFRQDLSAESVTIGKGPAAMLRIEDDALADLQAVINLNDDGTVQLLDLVGEGTKVNGEAVVNAELSDGDSIEIGEIKVVLGLPAPDEFADEEATQMMRTPETEGAEQVGDEVTEHTAPEGTPAETGDEPAAPVDTTEDVMAFIMRSGTSQSDVGVDRKAAPVLEVAEVWGDLLVDVKHYAKGSEPVTVGASTGARWRVLGRPVAWVPPGAAKVLPYTPPILSEVTEEWRTEFYVPNDNLPNDEFKLFTWEGNGWVCNISDKWAGFVDIGEERHTLQEVIESGKASSSGGGLYKLEVDENTRVVLDLGHVIFFAQMVPASKKLIAKITDDLDYPFLGIMTFVAFLGLMAGIIVSTMPPRPASETMEIPDRFVELLLEKPPPEQPKEKKPDMNPDAGEGAKAKKEEGKVGKKDAKMEKAKGEKVEMDKKKIDKEIAENAGVLGAMRDGAEMDGVFGSSGLSSDMAGGIGGLIGAKGTQIGSGGLSSLAPASAAAARRTPPSGLGTGRIGSAPRLQPGRRQLRRVVRGRHSKIGGDPSSWAPSIVAHRRRHQAEHEP
ncbi:MAG: FHA domain-containing protein [Alphaproteobacteria bacterium]|nr:FHA domain-containing protein [Alphaproteobacteria bacterium]